RVHQRPPRHRGRCVCQERGGSSCKDQLLPSGSAKNTNLPHGCTLTSLAATPRSTSCLRAAATSSTTIWTPFCDPGGISVIPVPITTEQADPGGVSCTNRRPSLTWW